MFLDLKHDLNLTDLQINEMKHDLNNYIEKLSYFGFFTKSILDIMMRLKDEFDYRYFSLHVEITPIDVDIISIEEMDAVKYWAMIYLENNKN